MLWGVMTSEQMFPDVPKLLFNSAFVPHTVWGLSAAKVFFLASTLLTKP
jgi:hypothetical protein